MLCVCDEDIQRRESKQAIEQCRAKKKHTKPNNRRTKLQKPKHTTILKKKQKQLRKEIKKTCDKKVKQHHRLHRRTQLCYIAFCARLKLAIFFQANSQIKFAKRSYQRIIIISRRFVLFYCIFIPTLYRVNIWIFFSLLFVWMVFLVLIRYLCVQLLAYHVKHILYVYLNLWSLHNFIALVPALCTQTPTTTTYNGVCKCVLMHRNFAIYLHFHFDK